MADKKPKTLREATEIAYMAEASLKSAIAHLGDKIADQEGYKVKGMDAVYRYLIDKYHWLPDQVRSLSVDDLNMLTADYPSKH